MTGFVSGSARRDKDEDMALDRAAHVQSEHPDDLEVMPADVEPPLLYPSKYGWFDDATPANATVPSIVSRVIEGSMPRTTSQEWLRAALLAVVLSGCGAAPMPTATDVRLESKATGRDALLITITTERDSPNGEIPSLKLRNIAAGDEFWAAFDAHGSPLPVNERVRITRGVIQVRLRLSTLKWARSRAALWPSGDLAHVVPPGEYEAVARLSPTRGDSLESNRIRLTIDASD